MKTRQQLLVGWTLFFLSALLLLGFIGAAWWWYRPSPDSNQTIVLPQTPKDQNRPGPKGRSREEKLSAYAAADQPKSISGVLVPLAGIVQPESSRYLGNPRGRRPPGDFLPPPPLRIARASEKIDPRLLDWLARRDAGLQSGQSPSADQFQELEQLLDQTQVSWSSLYGIGQGMAYFGGDEWSLPWYRAVIPRVEAELKTLAPDVPAIEEIHQALLRIARPFYRSKQYVDAAEVFGMIRELEEPGSKEAWKAGFWQAESWYLLGRSDKTASDKAVELFKAMLASPEAKDRSDAERAELHYGIGCALYQSKRYAESMPHFQTAAEAEDYDPKMAVRAFIRGSLELGRPQEAEEYYRVHVQTHGPPPSPEAKYFTSLIEKAKTSKQ